jgi:hypothetical protein
MEPIYTQAAAPVKILPFYDPIFKFNLIRIFVKCATSFPSNKITLVYLQISDLYSTEFVRTLFRHVSINSAECLL